MLIGQGDSILPGRNPGALPATKPPLKNLSRFTVRHFVKADLGMGIQALDVAQVVDATLDNPRGTFKKETAVLDKSINSLSKGLASVKDDTTYIRKEVREIKKLVKKLSAAAPGVAAPQSPFSPNLLEGGASIAGARTAVSLGLRITSRLAVPVAAGFGLAWLLTTKQGNNVISTFASVLDDMKHGISWQQKMFKHVQQQPQISTQGLTPEKMRIIEAGGIDFYKKQQAIIKKWQQEFLKPNTTKSPKKLPGAGSITKNQDFSNRGTSRTGAQVPNVQGNNKTGTNNPNLIAGPKATGYQKGASSAQSQSEKVTGFQKSIAGSPSQGDKATGFGKGIGNIADIGAKATGFGKGAGNTIEAGGKATGFAKSIGTTSLAATTKSILYKGQNRSISSDEALNIAADHLQNNGGNTSTKATPLKETLSDATNALSSPEDTSRISATAQNLSQINKTLPDRSESDVPTQELDTEKLTHTEEELKQSLLSTRQEYTSATTKRFQKILDQQSLKSATIPEEMQVDRALETKAFQAKTAMQWAKPWLDAIGRYDPKFNPSDEARKETVAARKELSDWRKRWLVAADGQTLTDSISGVTITADQYFSLEAAEKQKILSEYPLIELSTPYMTIGKKIVMGRETFEPKANTQASPSQTRDVTPNRNNNSASLESDVPSYKIQGPTQQELDTANNYLNPVAIPTGDLGLRNGSTGNEGEAQTSTSTPPARLNNARGEPTNTTLPSLSHSNLEPQEDQNLGATPPGPTGDPSNGRIGQAYRYLKSIGLSDAGAAGVIGSLQQESYKRLDPNASNPSGAYGIGQWTYSRQQDFKRVFGHPIQQSTFQEQLEFMGWEFKHTEKNAFAKINQAQTASAAALASSTYYERAGAGANNSARERYANEIAENASQYATAIQAPKPLKKASDPYANYKFSAQENNAYRLLQTIPDDPSKWSQEDQKTFMQAQKWATPAVYAKLYDSRNGVTSVATVSDDSGGKMSEKSTQISDNKPTQEKPNVSASGIPDWLSARSRREITGVNSGLAQTEIDAANALGFKFQVNEGLRSQAEANDNARRGIGVRDSQHLYGAANDIQLLDDNGKPISIPRSERNPNNPLYRKYMAFAAEVEKLGKQRGLNLRWGGNFKSGVTKDYVHFDMGLGYGQANPNQDPFNPNEVMTAEKSQAIPVPMAASLRPVETPTDNTTTTADETKSDKTEKVNTTPSVKPSTVAALPTVDETKHSTGKVRVPSPKVPSSIDLAIAKTALPPKKSRTATAFYRVKNRVKAGGYPLDLPLGDPDTSQSVFA